MIPVDFERGYALFAPLRFLSQSSSKLPSKAVISWHAIFRTIHFRCISPLVSLPLRIPRMADLQLSTTYKSGVRSIMISIAAVGHVLIVPEIHPQITTRRIKTKVLQNDWRQTFLRKEETQLILGKKIHQKIHPRFHSL